MNEFYVILLRNRKLLIVSGLWLSNLERASEYLGHVQVRLE